jgi:hypothetical protein
MNAQSMNFIRAFLHGFTGAGLFRKLDPGAPKYAIDPRSVDEIKASYEFDALMQSCKKQRDN